ncbi:MAG: phosphoglycerate kinase [Methanocellales archaeon]|nr:phosphoglycerate kinase [Methanocellales archaeon]MDD3291733.1 phosphoglycerate kinase [Methanocellales archaeon]MDD5235083.1 phosphoglycerate kinase [Methanocellales archaeon]MDD5485221.1 phosphoglycerate kinase [Methanocellales archaeon]
MYLADVKRDYLTMDDFNLSNKTVLVRLDLNSPIDPSTGSILSEEKFWSHADTLKRLERSRTVLLSHQSRPGKKDFTTMEPHAKMLGVVLRQKVTYVDDIFGACAQKAIEDMKVGDILLLENVRFYSEERVERSSEEHAKTHLVRGLAPHFDLFFNDAFASVHRSHASLVGFTEVLPSGAGKLMEKELDVLNKVLACADHPCIFVLGGAKAHDTLDVIENILSRDGADKIFLTGVAANIFLAASGVDIGAPSLQYIEKEGYSDEIPKAKILLQKFGDRIELPKDVALGKNGERVDVPIEKLPAEYPIWDIGLETIVKFQDEIKDAKMAILHGPAGVFEKENFALGTLEMMKAITKAGFSIVGGGHTGAAVQKAGLERKVTHVSTGGNACLNVLAGKELPGVMALKSAAKKFGSKR